jgi:hypothetical protein
MSPAFAWVLRLLPRRVPRDFGKNVSNINSYALARTVPDGDTHV